jgi:DNA modification methylase
MIEKVSILGYRCPKCGHEWLPRKGKTPRVCPNPECHTLLYGEDNNGKIEKLNVDDESDVIARGTEINFRERIADRRRTDYLTHAFFPYPAKFIPQIPRYFIKEYMHNHHTLLDPFCGSGTTLVEAQMLGYESYGIEINPLGRLLTEVKTTPLNLTKFKVEYEKLIQRLESGEIEPLIPEFPNKDYWFPKHIQEELGKIRKSIEEVKDESIKKFFLVCMVAIIRKCSNADPRISKPVYTAKMKLNQERKIDVLKSFKSKVLEYRERVFTLSNFLESNTVKATVIGNDAREIKLPDSSVYMVLTSPPFINAQEYFRTTKFEIYWTGLATPEEVKDMESKMVGLERVSNKDINELHQLNLAGLEKIDEITRRIYETDRQRAFIFYDYFVQMIKVFNEVKRVLYDEGFFVITIGDNTIRKISIKTHELVIAAAKHVGFKPITVNYDLIKVRQLSTKRNSTAGLMDKEWAMVFKKNL